MYAVVRLRGKRGTPKKILDTMKMLNLKKKFNCTIVPENDSYEGMLKKVENFVTWGEINEDVLSKLLEDRVELDEDTDRSEILENIQGGKKLTELNLKPNISLSPPSPSLSNSLKEIYPEGEAGYRGGNINELLERMI